MKKKIIGILTSSALLVGMLGTAASAQEDELLWHPDDVVAEDDQFVLVGPPGERPEQSAEITLEGPSSLAVDTPGIYKVTVENTSEKVDLASWKLGLGVQNITDLDEITISYHGDGGSADLTGGTPGVDVSLVDDVLYLRGSGDPAIPVGGAAHESEFEVTFHTDGAFTGTAYVIDEAESLILHANSPQYYPYYAQDGGTNPNNPPLIPRVAGELPEAYQCSLNRVRQDAPDGAGDPWARSDNWIECYDHADGSLFYWHYLVIITDGDPLWDTVVSRGAVPSDTGFAGEEWVAVSLNVFDGTTVHSVDTGSYEEMQNWVRWDPIP